MDIFDAVRDGNLEDVKRLYDGNINQVDNDLDLNLLTMAVTNDKLPEEKNKIIHFLLNEGIDINYTTKKNKRNALHMYYFCVLRPNPVVALEITKMLVDAGIFINEQDKFGAIPLKYAITINKLPTDQNKELYKYLLENESNYTLEDKFGMTCIDYAKEYSWRNDFLKIVEDYKNENK